MWVWNLGAISKDSRIFKDTMKPKSLAVSVIVFAMDLTRITHWVIQDSS